MTNCLTLARLYDYLEGLLSEQEKAEVARHLGACARCREVLEERQRLLEASRTLPDMKLPADFTRRVMKVAFPEKKRRPRWLVGLAVGAAASFASLVLISAVLALSTGRSWPEHLAASSRLLWRALEEGASILAKAVRLILTLLKIVGELVRAVGEGLTVLVQATTPLIYVLALTALALMTAASVIGLRKILERR